MEHSVSEESSKGAPVRVWVDGCFDLTHFGHANALRQAKGLGDQLVVGVHSDAEVTLHKGPPVFSEQERYRLIRAIKWVDELVENAPYVTTLETIKKNRCAFAAHGDDLTFTSDGSDPYHSVKVAGLYKEFKRTEGISTTELLSRILKRIEKLENKMKISTRNKSKTLRRSHSFDSFQATCLATSQSSRNENQNHVLNSSSDASESQNFGWSNCGISYMPNTLRITQFSIGKLDSLGLREPRPDDVVVYAPGAFDLFHVGHLSFLEKCLELGNYILIGLHSDSTATYENHRLGTILTLQERLLSVLACRYVCNVVIDAPYKISTRFIEHFKVDYVAVGKDTKLCLLANGDDPMKVPKQLGIFRRIDSGSTVTTSSVVARILKNRFDYEKRNRSKEAREGEAIAALNSKPTSLCS